MKKEVSKKSGPDNTFGIIALTLAIVSLSLAIGVPLGSISGTILAVLAFIFALVQRKKSKNKLLTWTIVLSVIGFVLNIVLLYFLISTLSGLVEQFQNLQATGGLEQFSQLQNVP